VDLCTLLSLLRDVGKAVGAAGVAGAVGAGVGGLAAAPDASLGNGAAAGGSDKAPMAGTPGWIGRTFQDSGPYEGYTDYWQVGDRVIKETVGSGHEQTWWEWFQNDFFRGPDFSSPVSVGRMHGQEYTRAPDS
jgi:hypothetical protein